MRLIYKSTLASTVGLAAILALRNKLLSLEPSIPEINDKRLIFYQVDYSPYCIKIRNILDYKLIPYEVITIIPPFHQKFNLKVSGQLKVPYIQYDDQVICDSTNIAFFLEALQPEPRLIPVETAMKEQVLFLEDWFDESVLPTFANYTYVHCANHPDLLSQDPHLNTGMPFIDKYKGYLMPMILKRQLYRRQLSRDMEAGLEIRLREVLQRLLFLLQDKTYLVGQAISLADLTLASYLKTLERIPAFLNHFDYAALFNWQKNILNEVSKTLAKKDTIYNQ